MDASAQEVEQVLKGVFGVEGVRVAVSGFKVGEAVKSTP
jgi:hypothetical protein